MEKNIASYDLSDMMVYEEMDARSKRFYFKQKFAHLKKVAEKAFGAVESTVKAIRNFVRTPQHSMHIKQTGFTSTATAVYAIFTASVLISFFWLTLLLNGTP